MNAGTSSILSKAIVRPGLGGQIGQELNIPSRLWLRGANGI